MADLGRVRPRLLNRRIELARGDARDRIAANEPQARIAAGVRTNDVGVAERGGKRRLRADRAHLDGGPLAQSFRAGDARAAKADVDHAAEERDAAVFNLDDEVAA